MEMILVFCSGETHQCAASVSGVISAREIHNYWIQSNKGQDESTWAQTEKHETPSEQRKTFLSHEDGWTLAQSAQTGCEVSIHGESQIQPDTILVNLLLTLLTQRLQGCTKSSQESQLQPFFNSDSVDIPLWWTDHECFVTGFSLVKQPDSQMPVSEVLSRQPTDFWVNKYVMATILFTDFYLALHVAPEHFQESSRV